MKKPIILIVTVLMALALASSAASARDQHGNCIVLDPAHGGRDEGVKVAMGRYEKDLTLKLALLIKADVERARGVKVVLTRSDDRDVSLAQRIAVGKAGSADFVLSLHVNAGFGKKATGYEMYFPGFSASGDGKGGAGAIVNDMVHTKALNESVRFAKILQRHLDRVLPRKDRDLREGPIRLREAATPVLLLEIGFASNGDDRKNLLDADVVKEMAAAIAAGIREFFSDPISRDLSRDKRANQD